MSFHLFPPIGATLSIVLTALCFVTIRLNHGQTSESEFLSFWTFTLSFFASLILAITSVCWAGLGIGGQGNAYLRHRLIGLVLGVIALVFILVFSFSSLFAFNR